MCHDVRKVRGSPQNVTFSLFVHTWRASESKTSPVTYSFRFHSEQITLHKKTFILLVSLIGTSMATMTNNLFCFCDAPVMTCQDPGNVEHSHKVITGSRFAVGSKVQFTCNKGYILSGSGLLTCYNRDSATPKWSERLPKCVRKSETPISWTQTYLAHTHTLSERFEYMI